MLKTSAVIELSTKVMSLFIALGDVERCNETIDLYADAQLSGMQHDIECKQKREAAWKKVQEITAVIFMVVTNESTAEQERDKLSDLIRLLQSACPHPTPTKRYRGDTGNYDKSEDIYWIDWCCPDCDTRWQSSQLDRMELTKYPNAIKIS